MWQEYKINGVRAGILNFLYVFWNNSNTYAILLSFFKDLSGPEGLTFYPKYNPYLSKNCVQNVSEIEPLCFSEHMLRNPVVELRAKAF